MPKTVPIRDLKDTAAFARLVEDSNAPVTVTRNGYDAFVVMRSRGADRDFGEGNYVDGEQFVNDIRSRYGL